MSFYHTGQVPLLPFFLVEFRKLRHALEIKVAGCCSVSTAQRRFQIMSLLTGVIGTFLGEVSRPSLME